MSQRIRVQPDQLRQSAQQLRQASSKIHDSGSRVSNAYNQMDAESRSAAGVGGRVRQAQSRAAALAEEAMRLATYLETKANAFEQADRAGFEGLRGIASSIEALQVSIKELPQTIPNQVGDLMFLGMLASSGVSTHLPITTVAVVSQQSASQVSNPTTTEEWKAFYRKQPWSKKFEELKQLDQEIARLQSQINRGITADHLKNSIKFYDKLIDETEQEIKRLEKEKDNWFGNILRTHDSYDRALETTKRNLETLKSDREKAVRMLSDIERLPNLLIQKQGLENDIKQGITPDGPTPNDLLRGTAGCTNYVAEKRDIRYWPNNKDEPGHPGNAYEWKNQAIRAGYEVGSVPVKGSILVYQPGVGGVDSKNGHVSYVENVAQNADGTYSVTISQANPNYEKDVNGIPIRDEKGQKIAILGQHTAESKQTIQVTSDGLLIDPKKGKIPGIDFIYDKKPSTSDSSGVPQQV
ncbi:MAG: CHAP domain-containing protein [Chloroflexales bacterium]